MDRPLDALRASALDLSTAARDAGEYEVAYHALCALLHAGESLNDAATCTLVAQRASECRAWLDANAPAHKLSSESAQRRGHESIFKQLTVTAQAAQLRIHADAQKREGRPKAPLADRRS